MSWFATLVFASGRSTTESNRGSFATLCCEKSPRDLDHFILTRLVIVILALAVYNTKRAIYEVWRVLVIHLAYKLGN